VRVIAKRIIGMLAVASAVLSTVGCGEFVRGSRSPSQVVIDVLEGPDGNTLRSDVIETDDDGVSTIFNDLADVTFRMILRDPGVPGAPSAPSAINEVTITRYRVAYRRADGRNTEGVDVPRSFDSALTVTVPADGTAGASFEIVRHAAKLEAPLASLRSGETFITTIAEITFYGRDQAGNELSVVGTMGVTFGNFADDES
jgi:hypothetical protein